MVHFRGNQAGTLWGNSAQYVDASEFGRLGFSHFLLQSQNALSPIDFIGEDGRNKRVEIQVTFVFSNSRSVIFKKDYLPLFSTIANITQFNSVVKNCNSNGVYHYSGRDCRRGTDGWASPTFLNYIEKNIESFKGASRTVLYNDFSVMNGGDVDDHLSHEVGNSLDLRLLDSKGIGFTESRKEPIFEKSVADELISMFSTWNDKKRVSNIEKVFMTYKKDNVQFVNSPIVSFASKLESVCMEDGRMLLDTNDTSRSLIRYREKHSDHMHIEHSDTIQSIPGDRVSDDPSRYSIQLIPGKDNQLKIYDNKLGKYITPDTHVLIGFAEVDKENEYKKGDELNLNKHYEGNGIFDLTSDIDYRKLPSYSGSDNFFYNNNTIALTKFISLKIVDKGSRKNGRACNVTKNFLKADLMIKKPLIFCPGRAGYNYSVELDGKVLPGLEMVEVRRVDGYYDSYFNCGIIKINSLKERSLLVKIKAIPLEQNGELEALEETFDIVVNSSSWNSIYYDENIGAGIKMKLVNNGEQRLYLERVYRSHQWLDSIYGGRFYDFSKVVEE